MEGGLTRHIIKRTTQPKEVKVLISSDEHALKFSFKGDIMIL